MARSTLRERLEVRAGKALLDLPPALLGKLAGKPIERDGFTLDPQSQLLTVLHKATGRKQTWQLGVEGARKEMESAARAFSPESPPLDRVEERFLQGAEGRLRARVYRPRGLPSGPAPALVYFHGGGWVVGSIDSHDGVCRALAADAEVVVISVDYRLAPEHPFPAPVDDAIAAFQSAAARAAELGIDPKRLAVGGDSAGGTLSAVVSQQLAGQEVSPRFQMLIYPAADLTKSFPSIRTMDRGFFLDGEALDWYLERYVPKGQDLKDPKVSPLYATERSFAGLPPAFVATCGFDPLRDEGNAYAEKMKAAGVPVEARCYGSLYHGFFNLSGGVAAAREPFADAAAAVRRALRG